MATEKSLEDIPLEHVKEVQYDVNAVWPLLSGVKPNDPNVAPPFC